MSTSTNHAPIHVTDGSFDKEVLQSSTPSVVDFWAEWCGPCKQIATSLEELAQEKGDKIRVVKLDIDSNPEIPTRYGIRSIPTLMFFANGELKATRVGALPKGLLFSWVEEQLNDSGD